jgi:hypothetical protein
MKLRKQDLREIVRGIYEENGARVDPQPGRGIIPGSRLKVTIGGDTRIVAIRTSLDREFSLNRHSDGSLATIPKVDEVAVAVPSRTGPGLVEVFGFDRDVVITAFDHAIAEQKQKYPNVSPKAPVFISLDDSTAVADFKSKARWTKVVALEGLKHATTKGRGENFSEFRERVRHEFAELYGIAVEDVIVEFRISDNSKANRR